MIMDIGDLIWRATGELLPGRHVRRLRHPRSLRSVVEGKRVVLTGASSGIGRETAMLLGGAGAEVVLVARRGKHLEEVAERIGKAHVHVCDLTDEGQVEGLVKSVLELGGADVLINNAGHSIRRALINSRNPFGDIDRQMRLNFYGALRLTLPLLEDMRARGGGHIVNVSTFGTQIGALPQFTGYLASKAAFEGFVRSAAPETRGDGVHWSIVNMPLVRTPMIGRVGIYDGSPAMSPRSASRLIAHAVTYRPARLSHPVGLAARLTDQVAPKLVERLMAGTLDPVRRPWETAARVGGPGGMRLADPRGG
jgi:short-subunit dehydrogenase